VGFTDREKFSTFQRAPRALSLGIKRPEREAYHLPPSGAEVKNTCSYTSTPHYVFMTWRLVKYRNNFTFHLFVPENEPLPSSSELVAL
jgi:hypothetical protein